MTDYSGDEKVSLVSKLATFALWLLTAFVGLWQIGLLRDTLLRLTFRFQQLDVNRFEQFRQQQVAGALGIMLVLFLGLLWIAVVIGGAEYVRRRVGKPESWRFFGRVLATEVAIALLPLFV